MDVAGWILRTPFSCCSKVGAYEAGVNFSEISKASGAVMSSTSARSAKPPAVYVPVVAASIEMYRYAASDGTESATLGTGASDPDAVVVRLEPVPVAV
jgi:hypothetical protein